MVVRVYVTGESCHISIFQFFSRYNMERLRSTASVEIPLDGRQNSYLYYLKNTKKWAAAPVTNHLAFLLLPQSSQC